MALDLPATVDQPAERVAKVTGPTASPAGATYPYETGRDPTYDAWLAQFGYQKQKAAADSDYGYAQAKQAYADQYANIDRTAGESRSNLTTSMLQRGVFGSGEQQRRSTDLESGVLRDRASADQVMAQQYAALSKDLADALASLDLQNQSQMAQAVDRVTMRDLAAQQAAQPAAAPAAAAPAAAPVVVVNQAPAAAAPPAAAPRPSPISGGLSKLLKKPAPAAPVVAAPAPPKKYVGKVGAS